MSTTPEPTIRPDTERRERYVGVILEALARDTTNGPNWGAAADAAMAVADEEQQGLRGEIDARRIELLRVNERHGEEKARATTLTADERQFLTFALDQAADEMSLGDGFTDEDRTALEKLRRMAAAGSGGQAEDGARPVETEWVVETKWRDGDWRRWNPARATRDEAKLDYARAVAQDADYPYRLVRATTTYTVETTGQAVDGAQQK